MSLDTCDRHDDTVVVYDSRGYSRMPCPLCEARETIEQLTDEIRELRNKE